MQAAATPPATLLTEICPTSTRLALWAPPQSNLRAVLRTWIRPNLQVQAPFLLLQLQEAAGIRPSPSPAKTSWAKELGGDDDGPLLPGNRRESSIFAQPVLSAHALLALHEHRAAPTRKSEWVHLDDLEHKLKHKKHPPSEDRVEL